MLESASFRLSLIVVEWSGQLSGIFIGNNSCDVTIGVIVPSGKRLQFFFLYIFRQFQSRFDIHSCGQASHASEGYKIKAVFIFSLFRAAFGINT